MSARLTRRERAAMELALEVLRHGPEPDGRCGCHGGVVHTEAGLDGCTRCDGYGGIPDPYVRHMQWAADILLSEDACAPVTVETWEAVAVQAECGGDLEQRIVRARLALYLRARLRADAGDCGPWRCAACDDECSRLDDHCYRDGDGDLAQPMVPHRRITPLWERATR